MTQMDIPLTPLRRKKIPEKTNPNRQARCIMATDTEWQNIARKAKDADLSISAYVWKKLLHDVEKPHATIPPPSESGDLQMEMLHLLMHQHKLLEDQYTAAGKKDLFDQRSKDVRIQFHIRKKF